MTLSMFQLDSTPNVNWSSILATNIVVSASVSPAGYVPSPTVKVTNGTIKTPGTESGQGFKRFTHPLIVVLGGNFGQWSNSDTILKVSSGASPQILSTWVRTLGVFSFLGTQAQLTGQLSNFGDERGPGGSGFSSGWIGTFVGSGNNPVNCTSAVEYGLGASVSTQPPANGFDSAATSGWTLVDKYGSTYDTISIALVNTLIKPRADGVFISANPPAKQMITNIPNPPRAKLKSVSSTPGPGALSFNGPPTVSVTVFFSQTPNLIKTITKNGIGF